MKTMAIRLEDDLHAQLSLVATLEGQTVTEIIRTAISGYIEERKEQLSSKADEALADIEREAAARREAIASLFGSGDTSATEAPTTGDTPAPRNLRSRRGGAAG
jgi:predicted transcriptional regulator